MSFDATRPFTRAQARSAGLRLSDLRTSRYRRPLMGVYVRSDQPHSAWQRAAAALATTPGPAYVSHASAARIYGLPIPTLPEEHVTVRRREARRRCPGVVYHYRTAASLLRRVNGVPVSSPAQTFVDLAGLLSLVDLVVVGDHLVRHKLVSLPKLVAFCAGYSGHGSRAARRAAAHVRTSVDSPMETRLRLLIVMAGLPEPKVNAGVFENGLLVRRYDLSYPEARVAIEYDGRQHIQREAEWEYDLDRREAVDDAGWRLLVVTSRGIFVDPEATLGRIHRVARSRGVVGVPVRLSDDWRPYFPAR